MLGASASGQVKDGCEAGGRVATAGQATDQGKACRPVLTCTLAFLESVAWLAGESLVAAEGAYCVHAVLAPATCVQVRHTLVDVCGESDAIRDCIQVLPRWWLSAVSTDLKVLTTQSSTMMTSTCLSIHSLDRDLLSTCHVPTSTVIGTRNSW